MEREPACLSLDMKMLNRWRLIQAQHMLQARQKVRVLADQPPPRTDAEVLGLSEQAQGRCIRRQNTQTFVYLQGNAGARGSVQLGCAAFNLLAQADNGVYARV